MATIILAKDGVELQKIPVLKERTRIGRRTHNDVVIDEPDISAEHAVIVNTSSDCYFEDLESTNGSRLNGQPIKKHFLQDGDVIELGRYTIRYRAEANVLPSRPSTKPISITESLGDLRQLTAPAYQEGEFIPSRFAAIQILNGHNAGKKIALTQALTTIGRPDIHVAALTHNERGYAVTHVQGSAIPVVNGKPIGAATQALSDGDLIDIAGTKILFIS
jgi:pSer/pThr/pTyr-binding forkhead associated (FHA) protein